MIERCPHDGAGFFVRVSDRGDLHILECIYCQCVFDPDGTVSQPSIFCRPLRPGGALFPAVQGASGSDLSRGEAPGRSSQTPARVAVPPRGGPGR